MRVSVVIPVHNPGDELRVQLEALAKQDYEDEFEVVLSNNNSSDGAIDSLDPRLTERLRLRVIEANDGVGPSYARNEGARHAAGSILLFCDQDDQVHPPWIRRMVEHLDETGSDIVGSAIEGDTLNVPGSRKIANLAPPETFQPPGVFAPVVIGCSLACVAEVYNALGGMREEYPANHDVELGWRATLSGYRVTYLPEALVAYRYRTGIKAGYRQGRIRGIDLAHLDLDFPDSGLPRPRMTSLVRELIALLFSWNLAGEEWGLMVGIVVGRIRGGLRYKTVGW